ncbi:MAG: DUF362 domain-containing protein [Desulfobacteraceae bacterium]|nr:DUF362 domain-containing protein [Desulfobacteraceae bacterium]
MPASTVYYMDLSAKWKENLVQKLGRLMARAGLAKTIRKRDLVAVKLHFGELGNLAYIRPPFLRRIVEDVRGAGGEPFLTDANTLYAGTRGDSVSHLKTAIVNGFSYAVVDAPLIIADGLRGRSETAVPIDGKRFDTVYIAEEIAAADALVSVAHVKGHELAGFGGTLKNLGMGCASRRGKLAQHSTVHPKVKKKRCVGCGECVAHCSQHALSLVEKKAVIDDARCIGCGECILVCPNGAIQIAWNQSVPVFLENMIEYTAGVLATKPKKAFFINFVTNVSPACDCLPFNDSPIVRDIGVLAATDPVAIDQAAVDLINQEAALPGAALKTHTAPGEDKLRGLYPEVDWPHQLAYAEQMKLGSRKYKLVRI